MFQSFFVSHNPFNCDDTSLMCPNTHTPSHQAPHLSLTLSQSEAAEGLSHSDSLSWLQVEAEVFGSLEQQNDGRTEVELSDCCALL